MSPDPPKAFGRWGLRSHTEKHSPPIVNFWLCAWLVVSTRNANALYQNFLSISRTKKYVNKRSNLETCKKTLNSPGKVLENNLKKSWKVLEFDFEVSVATLIPCFHTKELLDWKQCNLYFAPLQHYKQPLVKMHVTTQKCKDPYLVCTLHMV